MHRIRQRDVHRIDLVQAVLELIVRERVLESIALAQFTPFRSIVAHDRNELRVPSRMRERGKDRDLGDVTKTDHGVSDGFMDRHSRLPKVANTRAREARRIRQPRKKLIERPAVHNSVCRNVREPGMCQGGVRVRQLRRRMGVAVQREEASRITGTDRQGVIEVLSRRIAVDLNRHGSFRRKRKYAVPVGNHARA
jgi:hypothetical protein